MADAYESKRTWIGETMERYEQPLLRYAVSILGDLDPARDVVQDTFLRMWRADQEQLCDGLASWLFTVCRHRALDVLRKEHRMGRLDDMPVTAAADLQADPGVLAESSAEHREVLRVLHELPASQQEVVRLRFTGDVSYKEISAVTGKSVSNVGFLLHTALVTVRKQLREPAGDAASAEGGAS